MTNNETILMQNVADLQAQLAAANERIASLTGTVDDYNAAMRSLMSFLSVGGWAETITPEQGEAAIREGIEMLMKPASEWLAELMKERARLDWALSKAATFYEGQHSHYLAYDIAGHDGFECITTDNPRATIDELIAAEAAGESDERA